jgi:hypothetical protein
MHQRCCTVHLKSGQLCLCVRAPYPGQDGVGCIVSCVVKRLHPSTLYSLHEATVTVLGWQRLARQDPMAPRGAPHVPRKFGK